MIGSMTIGVAREIARRAVIERTVSGPSDRRDNGLPLHNSGSSPPEKPHCTASMSVSPRLIV
jgi:hypothetical protein